MCAYTKKKWSPWLGLTVSHGAAGQSPASLQPKYIAWLLSLTLAGATQLFFSGGHDIDGVWCIVAQRPPSQLALGEGWSGATLSFQLNQILFSSFLPKKKIPTLICDRTFSWQRFFDSPPSDF